MSILPWDNFIKDCYIRLENLVIDGSIKELEEDDPNMMVPSDLSDTSPCYRKEVVNQ